MVNGYGSREKPKLAPKMVHHVLRQDENPMAVDQTDEDISDAKPLAVSSGALLVANPKRTTVRLNIFLSAKKEKEKKEETKHLSLNSCILLYSLATH
jgi:hypothetical protein